MIFGRFLLEGGIMGIGMVLLLFYSRGILVKLDSLGVSVSCIFYVKYWFFLGFKGENIVFLVD